MEPVDSEAMGYGDHGSSNGDQKGSGGIFLWEFPKKNATTPFF